MSELTMDSKLDDVFALCVCENTHLEDVCADVGLFLYSRNRARPPLILLDFQRALFMADAHEAEILKQFLEAGVWTEVVQRGGRLAMVIGDLNRVCVCGRVELLEVLTEVSERSPHIKLTTSGDLALQWLLTGHAVGAIDAQYLQAEETVAS